MIISEVILSVILVLSITSRCYCDMNCSDEVKNYAAVTYCLEKRDPTSPYFDYPWRYGCGTACGSSADPYDECVYPCSTINVRSLSECQHVCNNVGYSLDYAETCMEACYAYWEIYGICEITEGQCYTSGYSEAPTFYPTYIWTHEPTLTPSYDSTSVPTLTPSYESTSVPTLTPSYDSTSVPTLTPSYDSTSVPTLTPTDILPTSTPSSIPSTTVLYTTTSNSSSLTIVSFVIIIVSATVIMALELKIYWMKKKSHRSRNHSIAKDTENPLQTKLLPTLLENDFDGLPEPSKKDFEPETNKIIVDDEQEHNRSNIVGVLTNNFGVEDVKERQVTLFKGVEDV